MDERVVSFIISNLAAKRESAVHTLESIHNQRQFAYKLTTTIKESGLRVFLLSGLRGVGKTTALYDLFLNYKSMKSAYFSCDELFSQRISLEDMLNALDYVEREKVGISKPFLLLLDEITYLKQWDLSLKIISDNRPKLYIIATASSSLPLNNTKELARRAIVLNALPFSFREYLLLKYDVTISDELSNTIKNKIGKEGLEGEYLKVLSLMKGKDLLAVFDEYLQNDLPFSLLVSKEDYKKKVIENIIKRVVYEDLSRFESYDSQLLPFAESMLTYLATVPCDGVKVLTLSQVIGISKESIVKILDSLERAMLIRGLEFEGRNRRFKKPKKWHFYSPSMRWLLAKSTTGSAELIGNLREDSALRHLEDLNVFYSHEADFIANNLKIEIGGPSKKTREGTIIVSASEKISKHQIPLPLFALRI